MIKLRVERKKDEPVDIFAMRAFSKALPHMTRSEVIAAAEWIYAKAMAEAKGMDKS